MIEVPSGVFVRPGVLCAAAVTACARLAAPLPACRPLARGVHLRRRLASAVAAAARDPGCSCRSWWRSPGGAAARLVPLARGVHLRRRLASAVAAAARGSWRSRAWLGRRSPRSAAAAELSLQIEHLRRDHEGATDTARAIEPGDVAPGNLDDVGDIAITLGPGRFGAEEPSRFQGRHEGERTTALAEDIDRLASIRSRWSPAASVPDQGHRTCTRRPAAAVGATWRSCQRGWSPTDATPGSRRA